MRTVRQIMIEAAETVREMNPRGVAHRLTAMDAHRLLAMMNEMLRALPPARTSEPPKPPARVQKNHALPDDWAPGARTLEWASQRCPEVDLGTELEKFLNYYHSIDGSRARRSNWDLAFRNWLLKACTDYRSRPGLRQSRDEKRQSIVRASQAGPLDDVLS